MEVFVFLVCMIFHLLLFFLSLGKPVVAILDVVFGSYIIGDLFINGLTEVIGYSESEVVHTYSVDAIILIPVLVNVLSMLFLWNSVRRR